MKKITKNTVFTPFQHLLLYSEECNDYVIGFYTRHYGDSLKRWPTAESVMAEVNRLIEQCQ